MLEAGLGVGVGVEWVGVALGLAIGHCTAILPRRMRQLLWTFADDSGWNSPEFPMFRG